MKLTSTHPGRLVEDDVDEQEFEEESEDSEAEDEIGAHQGATRRYPPPPRYAGSRPIMVERKEREAREAVGTEEALSSRNPGEPFV